MDGGADRAAGKPATAARMYDYYLGGIHNFPADREAAERVIAQFPAVPAASVCNRAFLRRAVRHLCGAGVRQFLDLGSGIPTEGNVHEIAQGAVPDARVVYVDIDPTAVVESLEILDGNDRATAIRADLRQPDTVLGHPQVRGMLDFDRPVAVMLVASLHFVPDDSVAYQLVRRFLDEVAAGSYLVISHAAAEHIPASGGQLKVADDVYRQRTSALVGARSRDQVAKFFAQTEMVEPGVVWLPQWRPDPNEPDPLAADPVNSINWAGVGRKVRSPAY